MSNQQITENPLGAGKKSALRVTFDSRLKLEFHGSKVTSDAGLLAYRELDEALGLTDLGEELLNDWRTGKNTQHSMVALMRQSIFSRLAGYEDTNDAERLAMDPTMRHVVGGRATEHTAASTSQMGRFETEVLTQPGNLKTLTKLSGKWIDRLRERQPMRELILDLDSSVSETYGDQEGTAFNGHLAAPATIHCFASTSLATWSSPCYETAMCIVPRIGGRCWNQWWLAIRVGTFRVIFEPMPPLPTRNSMSIWKPRVSSMPSVCQPMMRCCETSNQC